MGAGAAHRPASNEPTIRSRRGSRRLDPLRAVEAALNGLGLDALRFEGPAPSSRSGSCRARRWDGGHRRDRRRDPVPGQPPDRGGRSPRRTRSATDGVVTRDEAARRSRSGALVRGSARALRGRAGGRDRSRQRRRGAPRHDVRRDEGAARLGEVALVDRESRVGALDTVFYVDAPRRERRQPHRARERLPRDGRRARTASARTRAPSTSTS